MTAIEYRSAAWWQYNPATSMALTSGTRLGTYEVRALIGAGGMGEVYAAHDSKLDRDVAIKVLPEQFARDSERLARFQREAKMLASLNHPNIAAIYGIEQSGSTHYLVMELVPGQTLRERVAGEKPVPIEEALGIAKQIAEALEAAHGSEKGIIHRDLKPANVKMTPEGRVKVLDFGLAKAFAADTATEDPSNSPTLSMNPTIQGVIMGTAAYMSPEQARGQAVTKATDIFAFGAVLYELLTGRQAFPGEDVGDILATVVKSEPDWSRLPEATPPAIRTLLRRCLRKDWRQRLQDATGVRIEIEDVLSGAAPAEAVTAPRDNKRERLVWAGALALVALTAAVLGVRALRPAPTAPETRLELNTPPTSDPSLAISPDGLKIVFVGRSGGPPQLWLRSLDSPSARPLAGTERAAMPFWSPDSRAIGFFADSRLKIMDIDGGSAKALMSLAAAPQGGAWNRDGTIVFSPVPASPILRASAEGGEAVAVTRVESPQQRGHSFPQLLPDGRHFIFFVTGSPEGRGVYVGQFDGLDSRRLFEADAPAAYAASGHLLFVRQGTLWGQEFDVDRLELRGSPLAIAEQASAGTRVSASDAGPIAYRTASADSGQRQFVWFDRSGREIDKVVYPDTAALGPALSHDGRRVGILRLASSNMDIWSYETGRRLWDRLTFHPSDEIYPLWSPDGHSIVFGSGRPKMNLYRKLLSAPPNSEELLLATEQTKFAMDWSRDGRFLLYDSLDPKRGRDIWALPLEGDRKPFVVVQTDFNEQLPQFSPDGKWIAYQSDKSGRFEIFLRPFPGPGSDTPVSIDGGTQARWNPNGRELFYIAADDRLMAVPVSFSGGGGTVEPGAARALFVTDVGSTARNVNRQQYMVSPDGQSFVMNSIVGEASASPITVILNWKPRP